MEVESQTLKPYLNQFSIGHIAFLSMGMFIWRSETKALVSFFLLLSLFTCNVHYATSTQLMSNPIQADDSDSDICNNKFCGKGTCQASQTELLGFRCDCDSDWKKIKVGVAPLDFELPPCILPNCTLDMQCSNGILPPPQPPKDASNPCLVNFCGDGTCERVGSGFGFSCQCNEGSANLLNDPKMICLKKCAFGANCHGFDLGFLDSPSSPTPPTQQNNGSGNTGSSSGAMLNCSKELQMLTIMILATIFHKWI